MLFDQLFVELLIVVPAGVLSGSTPARARSGRLKSHAETTGIGWAAAWMGP